jgi:asparagine synthase (glutamine-hydrolysing)
MCQAIAHRGPDGHGVFTDLDAGVCLGHRRLSIIDLSIEGDQPMTSADGRLVIVFNGEIYNYTEVRAELEASSKSPKWRGHSDTEVLLETIAALGLEAALQRVEGQFAFALWDRSARRLYLARDRFGEKPLYYGWTKNALIFGSELKALRRHPDFDATLDPDAVASYFRYAYVPTPSSIYRSYRKLPQGTFATIDIAGISDRNLHIAPYWRLSDTVAEAQADPFTGTEEEATELLDQMLRKVVASRMVSDVPLGALLSGGIDSSTVVALMQAHSRRPIRTFTIGTWDKALNEAEHARETARIIGAEHTELYVGGQEALNVVPHLASMYDEPFADSSQIPTYLVSALARRHVTVALSGDGGDEVFGGYNRHFFGPVWRQVAGVPRPLRTAISGAIHAVPPAAWSAVVAAAGPLAPSVLRKGKGGDKLHKLASKLPADSERKFQLDVLSVWDDPNLILSHPAHALDVVDRLPDFDLGGFERRSMFVDTGNYLPDDILVKVDRASMASSLEVRAPFLDTRILRFAWSLPMEMKIRNRSGKRILKNVLARYVPRELFERPKQGFGVPVADWLRHELRDWCETLLTSQSLEASGLLKADAIRRTWKEHRDGARNWDTRLWAVLMFQAWLLDDAGANVLANNALSRTQPAPSTAASAAF